MVVVPHQGVDTECAECAMHGCVVMLTKQRNMQQRHFQIQTKTKQNKKKSAFNGDAPQQTAAGRSHTYVATTHPDVTHIKMWNTVMIFAVGVSVGVGVGVMAQEASVNITFQNHSHVVVSAEPGVYTYDVDDVHGVEAISVDFRAAPILNTYGHMT
jgi:hypothetical protein